jgi:hypothetical protein
VAALASDWFGQHLASARVAHPTEVDGWLTG